MTFSRYETKQQLVTLHDEENSNQISIFFYPNKKDLSNFECYIFDINALPKESFNKLIKYTSLAAVLKFAKKYHSYYTSQAPKEQTSCPASALTPAKSSEQERGILFVEVDTVGRGKDTEIIEISVVDSAENVLFHSRVRPSKPYKDVPMGEPSFAEIWQGLSTAIGRADIAFYNADFTKRYILQSIAKAFDTPKPEHFYTLFPYNKVICVGERYKEFNNYRLGYFRNYGLQHINSACGQSGLFWRDVSNSPSGNAIKSARLWKYLNHKAVA